MCMYTRAHGLLIWGLTFSADGRFLASGGDDTTILVWHIRKILASRDALVPGKGGGVGKAPVKTGKE